MRIIVELSVNTLCNITQKQRTQHTTNPNKSKKTTIHGQLIVILSVKTYSSFSSYIIRTIYNTEIASRRMLCSYILLEIYLFNILLIWIF